MHYFAGGRRGSRRRGWNFRHLLCEASEGPLCLYVLVCEQSHSVLGPRSRLQSGQRSRESRFGHYDAWDIKKHQHTMGDLCVPLRPAGKWFGAIAGELCQLCCVTSRALIKDS